MHVSLKQAVTIIIICNLFACSYADWSMPESHPISLEVMTANKKNHQDEQEFAGTVTSRVSPTIYAEMPGEVELLEKQSGDELHKGDVIAKIDEQAAKGAYISAKNSLEIAKNALDKFEKLYDSDNVSETTYQEVQAQYHQAHGQYMLAESNYKKSQVISPCDGKLGVVLIKKGSYVGPGVPISNIACHNSQLVDFYVPEPLLSSIKKGTFSIEVTGENHLFPAKLVAVDQAVNPRNRSALMRLQLTEPADLLQGQFVKVHQQSPDYRWITIPLTALELNQNQFYVYKVDDNDISRQAVTIGKINQDRVEIKTGINDEDQIIKAGWHLWQPGMKVNLVKSN
jgi:membrane fusion protein (multidrug efflux system)